METKAMRALTILTEWCAITLAAIAAYQRDSHRMLAAIFLILLVIYWRVEKVVPNA